MTNFAMKSYEDMFGTNSDNDFIEIPLTEISAFENHPFRVIDNEDMQELANSIKLNGVINPAIVRETPNGKYELISGHRRKRACELAGLTTLKCQVVDISDEEATVFMVDSNLQRTEILPSEKAFSYKMRLQAIKAMKENGIKGKSNNILAEEVGESREQVRRYIRLTELISPLLDYVDSGNLKLRAAVSLSYINKDYQNLLCDYIQAEEIFPSEKQAEEIRGLASADNFDEDTIDEVLRKKSTKKKVEIKIPLDSVKNYFPPDYTPEQIHDEILRYLERRAKVSGIKINNDKE